jgi:hypothetical protein
MIGAMQVRTPIMIFALIALACGAAFAGAEKHAFGNPVASMFPGTSGRGDDVARHSSPTPVTAPGIRQF